MNQMPLNIDPSLMQVGKVNRGGMFGNADWGSALAAALAGFSAGGGSPAGQFALQSLYANRQNKQRQAQEEAQYQRQRQDGMADWQAKQDYAAAHQAPDDFTQMMVRAGIDPNSDQAKTLYLQAVQNKANPFTQMRVQNPDGSETLQFMRPPTTPTAPVGKLTPISQGGPTPPASGGFPWWEQ